MVWFSSQNPSAVKTGREHICFSLVFVFPFTDVKDLMCCERSRLRTQAHNPNGFLIKMIWFIPLCMKNMFFWGFFCIILVFHRFICTIFNIPVLSLVKVTSLTLRSTSWNCHRLPVALCSDVTNVCLGMLPKPFRVTTTHFHKERWRQASLKRNDPSQCMFALQKLNRGASYDCWAGCDLTATTHTF